MTKLLRQFGLLTTFLVTLTPMTSWAHQGLTHHAPIESSSLHSLYHLALESGILLLLGLAAFFVMRHYLKQSRRRIRQTSKTRHGKR